MKMLRRGGLAVLLLGIISCTPDDSQAPLFSRVLVNGTVDTHHHAFSGQLNKIMVVLEDDRALRQVKITFEGGLHHGVTDPNNPFFRPATLGDWTLVQAGEVFGKSDAHEFEISIPWSASGPYTLQVAAIDEEGNEAEQSYHIDLVSDSLPVINVVPAQPFLSESSLILLQTGEQLHLEGYTLDLAGLALVRQFVRNEAGLILWQNEQVVPGNNVLQMGDYPFAAIEEPGLYSYVILSTNVSGRVNYKTAQVRVTD